MARQKNRTMYRFKEKKLLVFSTSNNRRMRDKIKMLCTKAD